MDYVNALMTDFRDGALLGVASGTTLRGYLAKNIHCGVKRVSKKLEGTSYNGRLTFKVKHHFSAAELRFRCGRLALLRAKFEQSVEDLKAREAQSNEGGTGVGEHRELQTHHLFPPPQASLFLQDTHLLGGAAFGVSTNDALIAEARDRFMGASNALLRDTRMSGLLTDTTMIPGFYNSATSQGFPGFTEGALALGGPSLESRVAALRRQQQQQQQVSMTDYVLESIRVRRSAISDHPFAGVGAIAPSSSTSLVSAALMRQNTSAGLPSSGIGAVTDTASQMELLRRSQSGSIGYTEAAFEAIRKRAAFTAGVNPGEAVTASLPIVAKSQVEDQDEPTKKRAKRM